MPDLQTNIMANLFRLSQTDVQNQYQTLINDLDSEIKSYRLMRMSDEAIYKALMADFENEVGVFGRFKGRLEGIMDGLVVQTTQQEQISVNPFGDQYDWTLDPTVEEHCISCVERSQMGPKDMLYWVSIGIPGSGATICGDYCMCVLNPSGNSL